MIRNLPQPHVMLNKLVKTGMNELTISRKLKVTQPTINRARNQKHAMGHKLYIRLYRLYFDEALAIEKGDKE